MRSLRFCGTAHILFQEHGAASAATAADRAEERFATINVGGFAYWKNIESFIYAPQLSFSSPYARQNMVEAIEKSIKKRNIIKSSVCAALAAYAVSGLPQEVKAEEQKPGTEHSIGIRPPEGWQQKEIPAAMCSTQMMLRGANWHDLYFITTDMSQRVTGTSPSPTAFVKEKSAAYIEEPLTPALASGIQRGILEQKSALMKFDNSGKSPKAAGITMDGKPVDLTEDYRIGFILEGVGSVIGNKELEKTVGSTRGGSKKFKCELIDVPVTILDVGNMNKAEVESFIKSQKSKF